MDIIQLLEEKRIKRFFQVKGKIIVEGGIYHITQRAPGREKVFVEETDYLYFLHLMKSVSKRFNLQIYAYALLPNHIHILLSITEKNLDKAMQKLFQRYAIYFNMKYHRKGHVFCGVYRCVLCNDESYILTASLYIHLNPFKAGIARNIFGYRWTSLDVYLRPNIKSFIQHENILGYLNSDINQAAKEYKRIFCEGANIKYKNRIETFDDWKEVFPNLVKKIIDLGGVDRKRKSSDMLEDIIRGIKKGCLRRKEDKGALAYAVEQLRSRGFSFVEIARLLGISRTKIYRTCNKISSELKMLHAAKEEGDER